MHSLLICRTCPRDGAASGAPGIVLAASLSGPLAACGVRILRVNCLGACRQPCAVALDAPSKFRLRFSNLGPADARDIELVAQRYRLSQNGRIPLESLPAGLRGRLSAVAPKTAGNPARPLNASSSPSDNG
jgi:predicted metal-binding protein